MLAQGGHLGTRMERNPENVDEGLENVSPSSSSSYFHGSFVRRALDGYIPKQRSGDVGEPEV